VPGAEVDERAPWQSASFIADYSAYSGPVTDRFTGSFVPGQAEEGAAAMVKTLTLVNPAGPLGVRAEGCCRD
jgi:hypothetical protein